MYLLGVLLVGAHRQGSAEVARDTKPAEQRGRKERDQRETIGACANKPRGSRRAGQSLLRWGGGEECNASYGTAVPAVRIYGRLCK